jgi:hypothetical protein
LVRKLFRYALLGLFVWGVVSVYRAYQSDEAWLAAHPDQLPPSNLTGRPPLDHTKPWYVLKGAPLCSTKQDLAALRDNAVLDQSKSLKERASAACFAAPRDMRVVEVERNGTFQPDYLVRLVEMPGNRLLGLR